MCGIDHTALLRMANNWSEEQAKPRGQKIKELLAAQGHPGNVLNIQNATPGMGTHVYTDKVCMAILEYYAFEATQGSNETALKNFRAFARESFRAFIFRTCGYDPDRHIPESWRNFHARVLLNDEIPLGYFCIFREIADLVVHLIKAGCPFDSHTVPDISVGQIWSKHWTKSGFDDQYGTRTKHPHIYPEWFPQSQGGSYDVWIYPAHALGVFHLWLYQYYIPSKFPAYLESKVKNGTFLPARADAVLVAMSRRESPRLAN
jgi:hypothetical protein